MTYGGGVRDVTASTSAAGDDAIPQSRRPEAIPYAAFDGNRLTAWETGGWDGPSGRWLRVDFDRARDVRNLTATFVQNTALGPRSRDLRRDRERKPGAGRPAEREPAAARSTRGPTRWLRLRITRLASTPIVPAFARAAIAEVAIGGVTPTRTYTMPAPSGIDGPTTY